MNAFNQLIENLRESPLLVLFAAFFALALLAIHTAITAYLFAYFLAKFLGGAV